MADRQLGEEARSAAASPGAAVLRRMALAALVLVLIQAAIGMVVNLYATIPRHHPGSNPGNYLSGSADSVGWAIAHGPTALAIHASLGLLLILMTLSLVLRSFAVPRRSVRGLAILATLLVIGAAFNGASFLDYNKDVSSLVMALLAFSAAACYAVLLFLLG
jgi:hypothetical protein